jgi:hypothetical protein
VADYFDPGARLTYFLTDDERIVHPDGPALVGPGRAPARPASACVRGAEPRATGVARGPGGTVDPHQTVLSFAEAADVVDLPVEILREAADEGKLTLREVDGLPGIRAGRLARLRAAIPGGAQGNPHRDGAGGSGIGHRGGDGWSAPSTTPESRRDAPEAPKKRGLVR